MNSVVLSSKKLRRSSLIQSHQAQKVAQPSLDFRFRAFNAIWLAKSHGQTQTAALSEIIAEKSSKVSPIKINEFRITGSSVETQQMRHRTL